MGRFTKAFREEEDIREESSFKKKFGKKYEDDEEETFTRKRKFDDEEEDEPKGGFSKRKGIFSKSGRDNTETNLSKEESYDFVQSAMLLSDEKKMAIIIPGKNKSLLSLSVVSDRGGRAKILTAKRYNIHEPESSDSIFKKIRNNMKNTNVSAEDFAKHIMATERAVLIDFQNDVDASLEYYEDGIDIGGLVCIPYINGDGQLAFKYEVVQRICQLIKDDSAF